MYHIQNPSDKYKLWVKFFLKGTKSLVRSKPSDYLDSLLSNTKPGSLIHYLNQEALIVDSYSWIENDYKVDSLILNFDLSKKGYDNLNTVLNLIFNYVSFIKKQGIVPHLVDELKNWKRLNWEFFEPCAISCSSYVFTNNIH